MDFASLKTQTFLDQERGHTEMEHHCTQTCKFHGYVIRLGARAVPKPFFFWAKACEPLAKKSKKCSSSFWVPKQAPIPVDAEM